MNVNVGLTILRYAVLIVCIVNAYSLVSLAFNKRNKFVQMSEQAINVAIGRSKSVYFSKENLSALMSKNGLMYMMKDYRLEPSTFILMKIGCGLVGAVLGLALANRFALGLLLAVGLFAVAFFIPDIVISSSNASDNIKMQDDIVAIFATLKIHARAGVYISDTLVECQRAVSNARLKEAFNELNNNILSRRVTVDDAVDIFNSRFNNEQIDNLSVIIKQALNTGRSTEMIADISKQIEDTNRARSMSSRDKLKRKVAIIQTTFFSLITVLVLYLVVMQMFVSLKDL